ncbi:MAG: DNA-processing protein DprA, partial [Steroidobacteraceae bacterium]
MRPLLDRFGSADSILAASAAELAGSGAQCALVDWLQNRRRQHDPGVDAELRWLEHDAHHFIPLDSETYPPLLAEVSDAPIGLFVR